MNSNPIHMLVVETSAETIGLLKTALAGGHLNATVTQVSSPEEGLRYLADKACDILLLGDQFNTAQLSEINQLRPDLPVVGLTSNRSASPFFQSAVPGVIDSLSTESADISSAARKVQLAIHKKLTEKLLNNAQENIDRLSNLAGEAFILFDKKSRILAVSDATEDILGQKNSELRGNPVTWWFEESTAMKIRSLLNQTSFKENSGFLPFQKGLLKAVKAENTEIDFSLGYLHFDTSEAFCLIIRDLSVRHTLETQIKHTLYFQNATAHLNAVREQNLALTDKLQYVLGILRALPYLIRHPPAGIGLIVKDSRQKVISPCHGIELTKEDKNNVFTSDIQESHGIFYFHDHQHDRYGFALTAAGSEPLGFLLLTERPPLLHHAELSSQFRLLLCTIALIIKDHIAKAKIGHLSTAIEQSPVGVVITDSEGNIQYANEALTEMTGYGREELLGNNPRILKSGLMADEVYSDLWSTIRQGKVWKGEIRNRRKDGIFYWESMLIAPVETPDEDRFDFIAIKENIDQRKRDERQLLQMATHDSLTELPNRALINDRLEQALSSARRYQDGLTLLVIDLDNFSMINNQHGHQAGDALLKVISSRLKEGRRKIDTVGRQGGDEFIIILPGLNAPDTVRPIVCAIIDRIRKPCKLRDMQLVISCSIGIATFQEGDVSATELFRQADLAMYEAKKDKGHSSQFFDESLSTRLDQRIWLREAVKKAISNDELALYYQPQIDMKTGQLSGAEALLRWVHPEKGHISPAEFVPMAEELGIISDLGDWVIEAVCWQLRQWLKIDCHLPRIAINLSAMQLLVEGFLSSFLACIKRYSIPSGLLEVEVTETSIMRFPNYSVRSLLTLRQQGISVAVDDFGTGYSSLSYLKRLPLDTLKIDRSFVSDLVNDLDSRTIAATIIDLGHNLNLKVLAEGVETIEQLELLNELGIDEYQGFYCSPAIPADEFANWLTDPGSLARRDAFVYGP